MVVAVYAAYAVAAPGTAQAGRTHYGWLYGTEVMPERGAEIQTWIFEENGRLPTDIHDTWWGASALVGVTDKLELALPIDTLWRVQDGAQPRFTVKWFGAEARYRFVSQDPVDAPPFAPLIRVAVKRDVTTRDVVRAEADLVASYQACRVHALVDIGAIGDFSRDDKHLDADAGAEAYAELSLDDKRKSWAIVGPNLAWTHGRFWLSASFGIGVYQIDTAPRATWGILF